MRAVFFVVALALLVVAVAAVQKPHNDLSKVIKHIFEKPEAQRTPAEKAQLGKYFTVGKPKITKIGSSKGPVQQTLKGEKSPATKAVDWATIVNTAKEVWKVIEDNKPVVHEQYDSGNAIPQGITDWTQMEGWQAPVSETYNVLYTNTFHMNVVEFTFRVTYTWGGSYQGKGKYLTACTIVSSELNVDWGYTFDATTKIPSVTNTGTTESPVAAMQMQLDYTVSTVVKDNHESVSYYVTGDGTCTQQ